jgi:hypothetical protein
MAATRARELLDLLEEHWRRQGAPMDLAPGATAAELDEAERRLGFALPELLAEQKDSDGRVFRTAWVPVTQATDRMLVVDCTAGGGDVAAPVHSVTTGPSTTGTSFGRRP